MCKVCGGSSNPPSRWLYAHKINCCGDNDENFSNAKGTSSDILVLREKEIQSQNKLMDYHPQSDGSFHEAHWVWSCEDIKKVFGRLFTIKTPTDFVSNLSNLK